MSITSQVQYAVVNSGAQVSEAVHTTNGFISGIWAPTVDSCALHMLGSVDQASANFVRLTDTSLSDSGAGDPAHTVPFKWGVGAGSAGIILDNKLQGFPAAKVELTVAQTDTRTLALFLTFGA